MPPVAGALPATMTITKEAVLKALSYVEEPDLGQDLVTLNMIENVTIEGLTVAFTVVLTTPACPLKDLIRTACERAMHEGVYSYRRILALTERLMTPGSICWLVALVVSVQSQHSIINKSPERAETFTNPSSAASLLLPER